EELSEIAPTVGYQINTDENWDYHETSLKVAEIFDKRDEMKKDLDRVDAREAVFAENVKAKFGNQKLMYLRVTDNDIRYYAYGHFGYLYDTYHFHRAETFNPDDMFQVIDPDKLKDINPDLLIVQADSQELLENKLKNNPVWSSLKAVQNNKVIYADYSTYMLGFGIVSQEAIMKQISDEWGLN
ncbi:ABC transporter substrate-binding protein, partial [uncultured Streptococcus sp.]|uniref:ABC transporter substrate-binding protein n=1 Tax=uncultured Streptococcus sp. TaxID=83427 RepID=UPI002593D3F9